MKVMKKVLALGLALALTVTAVPVTSAQAATTAALSKSSVTVAVGPDQEQVKTVTVTTPSTWKNVKVTSKSNKATVARSGVSGQTVRIRAKKKGTATVTVTVKATKSTGTAVSKTLKLAVTVVNAGLRFTTAPSEIVAGVPTEFVAKKCPTVSVVTYSSSNENVATVDPATGVVTGVAAGTVTITATSDYGKTVTTDVTVKEAVAALDTVAQTASNAFVATFTADASKTITKDDIKVVTADGSSELAVNTLEYSADGKSAVVTLFGNFTNAIVYTVSCKDVTAELTAKVGAVARVAISTASAEQNVETPIEFTLFDADGIDVTPSISLDTTCFVTITGDYSAANLEKASKASITMNTVGATADVTVTYNSNVSGAADVSATQTVTCVNAKQTLGTKLFAKTTNTNSKSNCAKFYLGLSDSSVSVDVGTSTSDVYFCAKDTAGNVISYDTYEVESSNDDVASAAATADSGKYAQITVYGNSVGSAQINVKATKNGQPTYYTIPVVVTTVAEAASMTVSIDRPTMSDVNDSDYFGTISADLYDKDGNWVAGNFSYEIETTATTPITLSGNKVFANGADEKTYTIKVTGADNNNNTKTFEKRVTVTVKKLPADTSALNLVYQIELDRTAVDENPSDTGDDSVTARLYATYNGLFAGYVRSASTDEGVDIANGNVTGSATTMISGVTVSAKFGTLTFGTTEGLVTTGEASTLGASGDTFIAVNSGAITYDVATKTSTGLAKTGLYTIQYSYEQNGKATSKTRTVTVSNSVFVPSVTVTTRTVDSLSDSDIVAALKTNVDMNNNNSDYDSIDTSSVVVTGTPTATKETVKSVEVVDNYGDTWTFVVPVNATFTAE